MKHAGTPISVGVLMLILAVGAAAARTPTPGSWAKAANIVCARWNADQKRVLPNGWPATNAGRIAAVEDLIKTNVTALAQLRAISPPVSERGSIATYLADAVAIDSQFQSEIHALQTHDTKSFNQHSDQAGRIDQLGNALLRNLGATVCVG